MQELYKRYRPQSLKTVFGQEGAIASLKRLMDGGNVPHSILLTGPSGVGKTTIARIVQRYVNCGDQDFIELNCADFKGVDVVRDIRKFMSLSPISGDTRMWLIDECHKLTNDAQNAFLKTLEDTPEHVYFVLCTTDPQKLLKTIHTRCSEIKLLSMSAQALRQVVDRVVKKESLEVEDEVLDEIIEASEGSARKALVILEQVAGLDGSEKQIAAIRTTTINKDLAIDLARLLVTNWRATWPDCAKILRGLKDEDAEGVRYCVLGYARACMVGSEEKGPNAKLAERAFKVIDIFSKNFYDSRQAGLAAASWEVING